MKPGIEKAKSRGTTPPSTSNPEVQDSADLSARMHFYTVRNAGDQLRWLAAPRVGKRADRMVGR